LARISTAPGATWRTLVPLAAAALAIVGVVLLGLSRFVSSPGEDDSGQPSVEYTTESGPGATEGVVNSPVKIAVRIPWSDGSQQGTVAAVTLQLVDEKGQAAMFGDTTPGPVTMRPTIDITVWEHVGSMPSRPGSYHARVDVHALYDESRTQTHDLQQPVLRAQAENGPPLRSGYVYNLEGNLWMLSTDASRQRRLTYFPVPDEYADDPAWSPDGKSIAFTYSPRTDLSQVPATEIWAAGPDGTGARQVVAHGQDESLLDPRWSSAAKYLFFTAQSTANQSTDNGWIVTQNRRIDRLETSSGVRSQWVPSAQMPSAGGPVGDLVYVEDVPGAQLGGYTGRRVVRSDAAGADASVLVNERAYPDVYGPQMSPDGRWVTFSAIEAVPPSAGRFDFFKWLLLEPSTAYAHEQPWDLYLVPAAGGAVTRLTTLKEDQPSPLWLDNSTIAFLGARGLYKVSIDSAGKPTAEPTNLHSGSLHATLTWHGP
jgi:hypothetical protein